jgi:DUF971 family protein
MAALARRAHIALQDGSEGGARQLPESRGWELKMVDTALQGRAWPTELRVSKDKRMLTVTFDDGRSYSLPAEYLRVTSPSAEVQGHSPSERKTVPGKTNVEIIGVEPVGNYAAKILFDDMHSTGIYGWDYLRELGEHQVERWANYLAELDAKGLSREPQPR